MRRIVKAPPASLACVTLAGLVLQMNDRPELMSTSKIPVYFRTEMVATTESFSPSAGKPAAVVADWRRCGFPIDVQSFDPVDVATLALAHDEDWVRRVLACKAPNGFAGSRTATCCCTRPAPTRMLTTRWAAG